MAIILPLITAFFSTPGVLPALFIGVFIMCLAFYRYKIEKYEDENLDENGHVQAYSNHSASVNSVDTEACTDCSCGKIQGKIFSVILVVHIMIRMSKDGGWSPRGQSTLVSGFCHPGISFWL